MSLETAKKLGLSACIMWFIAPIILVVAYVGLFFTLIGSYSSVYTGTFPSSVSNMLLPVTGLFGVIIADGVVSIIAFIFFLVAMYNLSKYYTEPSIFRNIIYSLIVGLAGSLAVAGVFVALIFATVGRYVGSGASPVSATPVFGIAAIIIFIVVTFGITITAAVFFRRAFCNLADKSGVEHFRTAGLLFLIGVFVPFVNYVALVFAALGYHRLAPVQATPGGYAATPYVASANGPVKRCLKCGAENSPESHYCRICGSQLS